jgi:Na+/melibiose symporter-like transporter
MDRRRTGADSSGAHFALLALTNKLGYAFAIGVAYPALQALGFQAGRPTTPTTEAAVLFVGLGLTAFLLAAAGLVAWVSRERGVTRLDAAFGDAAA